jgi:hypothetical protein
MAMALRWPRIPVVLQPFLSVWWLAHFGTAVALGLGVSLATKQLLAAHPFAGVALPLLLDFGVLFAANLYLLMAIAMFGQRLALWLRLWRWRIVVDLALTVGLRLLINR